MKKAMLALAAVISSCLLSNPAVWGADDAAGSASSVIQNTVDTSATGMPTNGAPSSPATVMAQQALGGMMQLGDILMWDIPAPSKAAQESKIAQGMGIEDKVMAAEAVPLTKDDKPSESAAPARAMAMAGCPLMNCHHHCPFSLQGPNALTDEQCQKLYEIKGQFITTIVPKGLSMYILIRKMGDLLTASDMDLKAVRETERQIASATSDMSMSVMDSLISVDQVLTPAQRQELHQQMIRFAIGAGRHLHHDEPHSDK